jgi:hypothetical protein
MGPPKVDNRQLHTGTGKLNTTAISTAAITTVIFSLVDRSMASSERDANLSAALYAASRAYAVMGITLRPAASRLYRRVRLSALAAGGAFGRGCGCVDTVGDATFGGSETAAESAVVFCPDAPSSFVSATAAYPAVARGETGPPRWRVGSPPLLRHARRQSDQLSACPSGFSASH